MPSGIREPEIVEVLEKKRAEVLSHPKSADAWGEYGMVLLAHLFAVEAEEAFAEAARLDPSDPRWEYAQGFISVKHELHTSDVPLDHLRRALATTGPGNEYRSAARLLLAETLLERGDVSAAGSLFDQELAASPRSARAQLGCGLMAAERGDAATAKRLLQPLLKDQAARKPALVQLARIAHAEGDETAAREYERETIGLIDTHWPDPLHDQVLMMSVGRRGRERTADLLERNQRYFEAAQVYLDLLDQERTPKNLIGVGINYVRMGRYEEAIAFFREAAALAPTDPQATYRLAHALYTRAEKAAIPPGVPPGVPESQWKGWFREAVIHAKRTTELKPDHAEAYMFWGLALKYLNEPQAAIEPFRKGLIARPESFELHLGLGQVLAAVGKPADAEKELIAAQNLDPDDPRPPDELKRLKVKKVSP